MQTALDQDVSDRMSDIEKKVMQCRVEAQNLQQQVEGWTSKIKDFALYGDAEIRKTSLVVSLYVEVMTSLSKKLPVRTFLLSKNRVC